MSICKFIAPTKKPIYTHSNFFVSTSQPTSTLSKERHKLKEERRQRGDRDTKRGLDKSQHAKKWYFAAFGSVRQRAGVSFIWSGGLCPKLSPGESPVMFVSMEVERLTGYLLAAWQKEPVVWLWQQQQPMAAQTSTSGSSLLGAHSDRPDSAKGNLSSLIPTPMARSNCHPSFFSQRWRDES